MDAPSPCKHKRKFLFSHLTGRTVLFIYILWNPGPGHTPDHVASYNTARIKCFQIQLKLNVVTKSRMSFIFGFKAIKDNGGTIDFDGFQTPISIPNFNLIRALSQHQASHMIETNRFPQWDAWASWNVYNCDGLFITTCHWPFLSLWCGQSISCFLLYNLTITKHPRRLTSELRKKYPKNQKAMSL